MHSQSYKLQGMLLSPVFFLCVFRLSRYILVNVFFFPQVLHLMNKMNLPAPFRMALPTPPLPSHVPAPSQPPPPPQPSATEGLCSADLSSDESELESSDVFSSYAFLVFTL